MAILSRRSLPRRPRLRSHYGDWNCSSTKYSDPTSKNGQEQNQEKSWYKKEICSSLPSMGWCQYQDEHRRVGEISDWTIFIKSDFMLSYIALDGARWACLASGWVDTHLLIFGGRLILMWFEFRVYYQSHSIHIYVCSYGWSCCHNIAHIWGSHIFEV